jgi:FAD/FMN-containing dehydrogenase
MNSTLESSLPIIWRKEARQAEYEQARVGRVFNQRRPLRYPRAVVEATEEAHVVDAVRLAIQQECRVSIRSGGHSWAAWSVRDDTILIDLGKYHLLEVDETSRMAIVSPSTTGRVLNGYLAQKGLMFAGGHCPDVGVGGFLLQGGMGWNCKNWGWACQQVLAIDAVTAQGELVHCTAEQYPSLFWCARGAGPGFPGVITKFYLQLRPSYSAMLSSAFFYPLSHYRVVMDWAIKISPGFDPDTEIVVVGATPPPELGIKEHCVMPLFVTFKNSEEEARAALEPANRTRPEGALLELIDQPTSLADQYEKQAAANPDHHRYCAENAYIGNEEDVPAVLEEAFKTSPHPKAFSLWYSMNPCSRRRLPDMALSMQSDHYFALYTVWEHESDDMRCRGWVRDIMAKVERHSIGAYLGDSDFQSRRTKFWGDEQGKKLMELRRKLDPRGTICGYLDLDDASGLRGLANKHEWEPATS